MLEEERESLSIAERVRLLSELIDKRKKLQAAQRYEAVRNKPQTMSRTKRAGLNLQEESSKRQKTSEVSGLAAEQQELGTLTLMLVAKLIVDEDSEIAKELLRMIVMQVDRPRR
ncbi:hypothetical protein Tco_0103252 [Tanacetum coccineum]